MENHICLEVTKKEPSNHMVPVIDDDDDDDDVGWFGSER